MYAAPGQDRRQRPPMPLAGRSGSRESGRYPPDQQRRSARLEAISGMPRRMAGQGTWSDPGDPLIFIDSTNLRRADRHYAPDEQHVALSTLAGVVQCRRRQPVSAFPRGQEHRGVGISRCTGGGQQAADMVRVRVGEEDGVNVLRADAEQRQIGDKRAADAVGPPCRYPPAPCARVRGSGKRRSRWFPARLPRPGAADAPPLPGQSPPVTSAAPSSGHH